MSINSLNINKGQEMNGYKIAFWAVIGLIYAAMFWVLPIYLSGSAHYIVKVLTLHGMTCLVLSPVVLLSYLAAKAGF